MKIRVVYDNGRAGKEFIDAVCALKAFDKRIADDEIEWSDGTPAILRRLHDDILTGDTVLELHVEK